MHLEAIWNMRSLTDTQHILLPECCQCGSMVPFILNWCTREREHENRRKNAAHAILFSARESINFLLRKEIARKTPDTYFNLFQFVELNKYGLTVWHNWISIATVWQHEKWTNRIYIFHNLLNALDFCADSRFQYSSNTLHLCRSPFYRSIYAFSTTVHSFIVAQIL